MRLGELKPKGSDMTFDEFADKCRSQGVCADCSVRNLCEAYFASIIISEVEGLFECEIEQTPKKVTHVETLKKSCTCPNCKNVIDEFKRFGDNMVRMKYNYCKFCGQALDWSNEHDG